eukprot:jgi/Bigna1/80977/fgenesh1_pg.76_\
MESSVEATKLISSVAKELEAREYDMEIAILLSNPSIDSKQVRDLGVKIAGLGTTRDRSNIFICKIDTVSFPSLPSPGWRSLLVFQIKEARRKMCLHADESTLSRANKIMKYLNALQKRLEKGIAKGGGVRLDCVSQKHEDCKMNRNQLRADDAGNSAGNDMPNNPVAVAAVGPHTNKQTPFVSTIGQNYRGDQEFERIARPEENKGKRQGRRKRDKGATFQVGAGESSSSSSDGSNKNETRIVINFGDAKEADQVVFTSSRDHGETTIGDLWRAASRHLNGSVAFRLLSGDMVLTDMYCTPSEFQDHMKLSDLGLGGDEGGGGGGGGSTTVVDVELAEEPGGAQKRGKESIIILDGSDEESGGDSCDEDLEYQRNRLEQGLKNKQQQEQYIAPSSHQPSASRKKKNGQDAAWSSDSKAKDAEENEKENKEGAEGGGRNDGEEEAVAPNNGDCLYARYHALHAKLERMGFMDKELNELLLCNTKGNYDVVVTWLRQTARGSIVELYSRYPRRFSSNRTSNNTSSVVMKMENDVRLIPRSLYHCFPKTICTRLSGCMKAQR